MSKRKSSVDLAVGNMKRLKSLPPTSKAAVKSARCTRSSGAKAQELIKKQVDVSSDDDDSDDDFIVPDQPSTSATGVVVQPVNSFLSDSSSSENEDEPCVHQKKHSKHLKKKTNKQSTDSDSSSSYFEQPTPRMSNGKSVTSVDSFEAIETNILAGVSRLSDSDDSDMEDLGPSTFVPTHVLFPSLATNDVANEETKVTNANSSKGRMKTSKAVAVKKESLSNKVAMLDVSELLAMGESQNSNLKSSKLTSSPKKQVPGPSASKKEEKTSRKNIKHNKQQSKNKNTSSDKKLKSPAKTRTGREVLSDSENDWEEVDHIDEKDVTHAVIPKEGVQITVQLPDIFQKKKKKEFDVDAHIKRRINQIKRDNQILVHQVSLLCWLGHGMYVNSILNSPSLMGFALSLIPSQHCYPPKQVDLKYLEKITQWFKKNIIVLNEEDPLDKTLQEILEECLQSKKAYNKRVLVLLFICMLRSLGVKARLVLSLQPLPLKPRSEDLCSFTVKKENEPSTSKQQEKPTVKKNPKPAENKKGGKVSKEIEIKSAKNPGVKSGKTSKYFSPKPSSDAKPKNSKENAEIKSKSVSGKISAKKTELTDPQKKNISSKPLPKHKASSSSHGNKNASPKPSSTPGNSSKDKSKVTKKEESARPAARSLRGRKPSKYKDDTSDESEGGKKETKSRSKARKSSASSQVKNPQPLKMEHSDSDFEPEIISVRKSQGKAIDRKVLSSEEDNSPSTPKGAKVKPGVDVWTEVFVEMEEKWICVDLPNGKVHCVSELYSKATSPVKYVMAFGMDSSLRDVTRRYCPQFYTSTRKQRVDADWWDSAIKPFYGRRSVYDREEEEELDKQLQDRPLPTSIGEYKKHPLYVLKRHLLKFEALYPPEAATVGFIRGEAVYSRDCVFTLRSRETWMKEAKIVKPKEEPYKIVKSRPKYDRMSGQMVTDRPLEIFGPWQVEDYIPPPAVDGKVPRNEYGNVELFKPTMLPGGTVHLQIPGLSRIAKKLQIDCAPAMVGFDFHGGSTHPLFDGFVVCEEFKDTLLDAHRQDEEERERRHEEKRLKRIYGNWRKLINGLLIREKLNKKYCIGSQAASSSKSTTSSKTSGSAKKPLPAKLGHGRKGKRKSTSESDSD